MRAVRTLCSWVSWSNARWRSCAASSFSLALFRNPTSSASLFSALLFRISNSSSLRSMVRPISCIFASLSPSSACALSSSTVFCDAPRSTSSCSAASLDLARDWDASRAARIISVSLLCIAVCSLPLVAACSHSSSKAFTLPRASSLSLSAACILLLTSLTSLSSTTSLPLASSLSFSTSLSLFCSLVLSLVIDERISSSSSRALSHSPTSPAALALSLLASALFLSASREREALRARSSEMAEDCSPTSLRSFSSSSCFSLTSLIAFSFCSFASSTTFLTSSFSAESF
mmetsp:Transcript_52750/g.127752  ORF Transcript_52750/g.127752 Transcript_52750/m.127752 type:complete len:289 (-) Transcript_52750:42-908(-)